MTAAADDRLISRHRPAGATASLPLTARDLLSDDPDVAGQVEPLGPGWMTVAVIIGIMAALIALGGMILSFRAVSAEMVPAFGARWAWLVPIVVDLTVFVFSGVDLVLARLDMSHPLARWTVYGATGGTVWLNYSAGGSAAGRVAHVLMPSIWVVFIELMRHVVRRQVNLATASHREPIPTTRWLLSPWPTLKLWRRMVLWRINSYPRALEQEKMRLGAVAAAREIYGRFWRLRISPLTKLQINLGELGAHDLLPGGFGGGIGGVGGARGVASPVGGVGVRGGGVGVPVAETGAAAEAVVNGSEAAAAPKGVAGVAVAADAVAAAGPAQVPQARDVPVREVAVQGAAHAANGVAAAVVGPNHAAHAAPSPQSPQSVAPTRHAAPHPVNGTQANGPGRPQAQLAQAAPSVQSVQSVPAGPPGHRVLPPQYAPPSGPAEPIPGVAAAGAAAGAVARGIPPQISGAVLPSAQLPAQRAHAAPPAVALPRQEPPHVEFQAPPPMPPMPRRSTRESELLTAAREVERWRGQPSATRISRELGIGMPLATSLANALREEEGPGQDDG